MIEEVVQEDKEWAEAREELHEHVKELRGWTDQLIPTPAKIMQMVIDEVSSTYECNRGPRASGAMIITRAKVPIIGRVKPCCESAPSCLDELPNAEDHDMNNCLMEHDHCVRNLHAEVAAIVTAARTGLSTKNAVILSINKPCYNCTMHIIAAGITHIYYAYIVYDEQRTTDIIKASGIECIHVPLD